MHNYDYPPEFFWRFLVIGYLLTIAIEAPILLVALSRGHSLARRLFAGVWLTACTYPIVVLVLPMVVPPLFAHPQAGEWAYLAVAETFAPVAECLLFSLLVKRQGGTVVEEISMLDQAAKPMETPASLHTPANNPYKSPQAESIARAMDPTSHSASWQDYAAITAANLASFLGGGWLIENVAWFKELFAPYV